MILADIKSLQNEDISILVNIENHPHSYLCECGDASLLSIKETNNCQAIFISHTHIDHFSNFDTILRHQIGCQKTISVVGPKDIAQHIQARVQSYTWNLISENAITYEVREVHETEIQTYTFKPPYWKKELIKIEAQEESMIIYQTKDFFVKGILLDHKTPVLAYQFVENDRLNIDLKQIDFKPGKWINELKKAYKERNEEAKIEIEGKEYIAKELFFLLDVKKGDSFGVIMDHAPHDENHFLIKKLFGDCKKVMIESFYKNEDKDLALKNHHSYAKKSAEILRMCNVSEAIPVHFSRKYTEEDITALKEQFYASFNI